MRQFNLSKITAFNNPHLTAVYIFISILFILPLAGFFWNIFLINSVSYAFIINNYLSPLLLTLILGISVSLFSLFIAIIALYCIVHVHNKFNKIFLFLAPIPLIFPPYIGAITYMDIFTSASYRELAGRSDILEIMQAIFVMSLFLYPYIFLLLYSKLKMIDPQHYSILSLHKFSLIEKLKVFYIPHLKYAAFSGVMIAFLYTVSDFGAVSILRMDTLTVRIYYEFITRFNMPEASILALFFILLSVITTFLVNRAGKHGKSHKRGGNESFAKFYRNKNILSIVILLVLFLFSTGVPLYKIFYWLYMYAIDTSSFKEIWINAKQPLLWVGFSSFFIAILAAVLSVAIPFMLYAMSFQKRSFYNNIPYLLAVILHTLPGIVIAFGAAILKIYSGSTIYFGWLFFLVAYIYRYCGIAFIVLEPAVRNIPSKHILTGRVYISSKLAFISTIFFPFVKPAIVNSGNYIFFNSVRDLAIPLILLPIGFEVLSIRIWQTAGEGLYIYAAPAIIVLLALSLPSVIIFVRNNI